MKHQRVKMEETVVMIPMKKKMMMTEKIKMNMRRMDSLLMMKLMRMRIPMMKVSFFCRFLLEIGNTYVDP
jgi:hypothetical protein